MWIPHGIKITCTREHEAVYFACSDTVLMIVLVQFSVQAYTDLQIVLHSRPLVLGAIVWGRISKHDF